MQSRPASPHLSPLKSSVMCCGLCHGSALATSPNISSGLFSPPIWQCNRTDMWTVARTSQRYWLLEKERRSSVCWGWAVETLVLCKRERKVGLSFLSPFLWGLDRGSAGAHCCSVWLSWRCCLPFPFPGNQWVCSRSPKPMGLVGRPQSRKASQETISRTAAAVQCAVSNPLWHPDAIFKWFMAILEVLEWKVL